LDNLISSLEDANGRGYVRLLAYDVEAESKLIAPDGAHERMDE